MAVCEGLSSRGTICLKKCETLDVVSDHKRCQISKKCYVFLSKRCKKNFRTRLQIKNVKKIKVQIKLHVDEMAQINPICFIKHEIDLIENCSLIYV